MEHCLLFFEHPLLVSHLRQQNVSYTVKQKGGLRKYHRRKNVVAYVRSMEQVRSNDDFKHIQPLFVVERPYGNSIQHFNDFCSFFDTHGYDYVFADHYMFKNNVLDIDNLSHCFRNIRKIEVVVKECGSMNVHDVYKSSVMLSAMVLERMYPGDSLNNILVDMTDEYKGTSLVYTLKENEPIRDHALYLYTDTTKQRIPLDDSDGYGRMVSMLRWGDYRGFLSRQQVFFLLKRTYTG